MTTKAEDMIEQEERRNGGRRSKEMFFCLPPLLRFSCSMGFPIRFSCVLMTSYVSHGNRHDNEGRRHD
jgi:hypothetical protein